MKLSIRTTTIAALVCGIASISAEETTTRPLFNGKDLSGWKGEGYVVEDGAIVCSPKGRNLITEETFSNYILDFEFKLSPGANNGLGIHYPGTGDAAYTGMEIQILDNTAPKYKDLKDYQFHGSLYTLAPAKREALKPVGEWNQERVTVMGPALKVELNGEIILRANLDDLSAKPPGSPGRQTPRRPHRMARPRRPCCLPEHQHHRAAARRQRSGSQGRRIHENLRRQHARRLETRA